MIIMNCVKINNELRGNYLYMYSIVHIYIAMRTVKYFFSIVLQSGIVISTKSPIDDYLQNLKFPESKTKSYTHIKLSFQSLNLPLKCLNH